MKKEGMMVVDVKNTVIRLSELRFTASVNWRVDEGQQWAMVGPNGAGKTLIADIMQHKFVFKEDEIMFSGDGKVNDSIKSIAFRGIYSLADCWNSYYQQRWHSTETEEMPIVEELLKEYAGSDNLAKILILFGIEDLLPKRPIFLPSSKLRKFLIVRTLPSCPRVLIPDNPFIDLDAPSRNLLVEMLRQMTKLNDIQAVLLLSNPNDMPVMITHALPIHDRTCLPPLTRGEFVSDTELVARSFSTEGIHACEEVGKVRLPVDMNKIASLHEVTSHMEHAKIRYGSRTILKDLGRETKNGEKQASFGPDGADKSTLSSLVYADNPQSYANMLYLLDRKRGSGESIWDIRECIEYVSPGIHLYYKENTPTLSIVGSGFFDSIGLFRKYNAEQETVALEWMKVFGIEHLKDRLFLTLSSGEQRLALLAGAFVKDSDLIISDEPLHGPDVSNKKKAAAIIEQFCDHPGETLIYVTHYPRGLSACVSK